MDASGCDGLGRPRGARSGAARSGMRVLERIAGLMRRLQDDLGGAARNRRILHRLATLSDRELKDIGLWRQDVNDAALFGNGDVAAFLNGRRDARRAVRQVLWRGRGG